MFFDRSADGLWTQGALLTNAEGIRFSGEGRLVCVIPWDEKLFDTNQWQHRISATPAKVGRRCQWFKCSIRYTIFKKQYINN